MLNKWAISQLGGISALALVAAGLGATPGEAAVCTAAHTSGDGVVQFVRVNCVEGEGGEGEEAVHPFATSYSSSSESDPDYDGGGDDVVIFRGGLATSSAEQTPTVVTLSPPAQLDSTEDNSISLLGGDDLFIFRGGQIGEPEARIDIRLGEGNDHFVMDGGTLYGDVLGEAGDDRIGVFGGTVAGSLLGGEGNDAIGVFGPGPVNLTTAELVAFYGPEGERLLSLAQSGQLSEEPVEITGGVVEVDIQGGAGDDLIGVFGGVVGGNVYGGAGDDRIGVFGGDVRGNVWGGPGDDRILVLDSAIGDGFFGGPGPHTIGEPDGDAETLEITGHVVGQPPYPDRDSRLGWVNGGDGGDAITFSRSRVSGGVVGEEGDDTIVVSGSHVGGVFIEDGRVWVVGWVNGGDGDDTITVENSFVGRIVYGGDGNDRITISNSTIGVVRFDGNGQGTWLDGMVGGGEGDDVIIVSDSAVGRVYGDGGNDTITILRTNVAGSVSGGPGDDTIRVSGGSVGTRTTGTPEDGLGGSVFGGAGDDTIEISGNANIRGHIYGDAGNDTISVSDSMIGMMTTGTPEQGRGGSIFGGAGNDTIEISGNANIRGYVSGGSGDDTIIVSGNANIGGGVFGGADNDVITVSGNASIAGDVCGGAGNDTIAVSGNASIGGNVCGGTGNDVVTMTGGSVAGGIQAATVNLHGGRVGGNITGLTGNTLFIDESLSQTPLQLADGVSFSGVNAVGIIRNTDLAQPVPFGGESPAVRSFNSQTFTGFSRLDVDRSTIGFTGNQIIDQLNLANQSALHVRGTVRIESQAGGLGNLRIDNSALNMVNDDTSDVLVVNDLSLNNARLAIDVNQRDGLADRITASGAVNAGGSNVLQVNLVGPPDLANAADIPLIAGLGTGVAETFSIEGLPRTTAQLFDYRLVRDADGGLSLRVTPVPERINNRGATNSQAVTNVLDTIGDVANTAADLGLDLGGGRTAMQIAPSIGVFSSGQFARVRHQGFRISGGGATLDGPGFTANDFSLVVSVDFNAAQHFGFADRYGLNVGAFGGYASSAVTFEPFLNLPTSIGTATNRSGMFGGYTLFRQGFNYVLVSGTSFIGRTRVNNRAVNASGSYSTLGFAATASAGRIFPLTDRVRFDLRGGLLGVNFTGDSYTDSIGNRFGNSRISFGGVKFEPGVFATHRFENGMVISPYARLELQQRFGYRNTGSFGNAQFSFSDANFSTSVSTGFNLNVSERMTVGAEIRGRFSKDSTTVAGKVGIKASF